MTRPCTMTNLSAESLTETVVAHCPPLEENILQRVVEEDEVSENHDDSLFEECDERGLLTGLQRRGRNPVERWKYTVLKDGKEHSYMCNICGIRYKHRKSLNKHWKDKHWSTHSNLDLNPPPLQPQDQCIKRKRPFSEISRDGCQENEDEQLPISKRSNCSLSTEEHENVLRVLTNNGQALSRFVKLALTQHPELRETIPDCRQRETDRPPILSPQVKSDARNCQEFDEVDGPLDLTYAPLFENSARISGPEVGSSPIDLSGRKRTDEIPGTKDSPVTKLNPSFNDVTMHNANIKELEDATSTAKSTKNFLPSSNISKPLEDLHALSIQYKNITKTLPLLQEIKTEGLKVGPLESIAKFAASPRTLNASVNENLSAEIKDENSENNIPKDTGLKNRSCGDRRMKSPRKCHQCSIVCHDADELNDHFRSEHFHSLIMEMDHRRTTPGSDLTDAELDQARSSLEGTNQITFRCPFPKCRYFSKWPTDLQKHYKAHTNTRNEVCMVCGSSYKWKWDLGRHFENCHKVLPNPYKKNSPTIHMNADPSDVNRLICDLSNQLEALKQACGVNSPPTSRHRVPPLCADNFGPSAPVQPGGLLSELMGPVTTQIVGSISNTTPLVATGAPSGNTFISNIHGNFSTPNTQLSSYVSFNHGRPSDPGPSMTPLFSSPIPTQQPHPHHSFVSALTNTKTMTPNTSTVNKSKLPGQYRRRTIAMEVGPQIECEASGQTSKDQVAHYQPHVCPHPNCDFRARWASELKSHMLNHSDFRPFGCPFCVYKSKWKWDTVKHIKRCATNHNQILPESNRDIMAMMRVYKSDEQYEESLTSLDPARSSPNNSFLSGVILPEHADSSSVNSAVVIKGETRADTSNEGEEELTIDVGTEPIPPQLTQQEKIIVDGPTPLRLTLQKCGYCDYLARTVEELQEHVDLCHHK